MARPTLWRSQKEVAALDTLPLSRLLEDYDVLSVEPTHMVVSKREATSVKSLADDLNINNLELGSASPSPYTAYLREEYNSELRGVQGLRKYDQMRRGDATVRSALRQIKTPVLAGRWFVEPYSESSRDVNAADFIWEALNTMSITWTQFLTESLLMCDYGYYMFEKVFEQRADGKIYWKKLAPRHPLDVSSWKMDRGGGPLAAIMNPIDDKNMDNIIIPISKLLVFTFDKEADNIAGTSVLRSAYKHWYYKDNLYKIDAIQKERHGIGIPIIKLPPGFSTTDRNLANELGRNLRTNERAHVVLPPNWELVFAKLEGQRVDALASAEHHDRMILESILSPFASNLGGDAAKSRMDMFLKASRFIADIVADTINTYAIPQLLDFNYSKLKGYPKLRVRRVGEQEDWRTISFAIRNLVGANVLTPDARLEEHMRKEFDLPLADPETARMTKASQAGAVQPPAPPQVGPPRQGPPSSQPPKTTPGVDQSGGN